MKADIETWLTDDLWNKMDEASTNFAFEQGEKYIQELQEVAKAISNRCYMMLGVIVTVCPFFITTSIATHDISLKCISYMFTAFCVGLSIFITGIVKPCRGYSIGRDPKSLLRICDLEHREATESSIKLYELENLQHKIEQLERENTFHAKQQTIAMYAIVAALSVSLILSALL